MLKAAKSHLSNKNNRLAGSVACVVIYRHAIGRLCLHPPLVFRLPGPTPFIQTWLSLGPPGAGAVRRSPAVAPAKSWRNGDGGGATRP
jgi:hypothetical protein